mmetsp:Transcript_17695/g.28752  ORF Transcript_17695/g.28752 Transcript_17695/m.28752 type:complete len:303 (+) Transcript_17695:64-972(+)
MHGAVAAWRKVFGRHVALSWSCEASPWALRTSRAGVSTDGPWRHLRPNIVEKKKHYGRVLVTADRRKILETAQDVLNEPDKHYGGRFWEVMSKRSIRSMHLFQPLELAILARAFDHHDVQMKGLNVFKAIGDQARTTTSAFPGLAVLVMVDVLSRRLCTSDGKPWHGTADLMQRLGRHASSSMWELHCEHAVRVLEVLSALDIKDASLCLRVAAKVANEMDGLSLKILGKAAVAFAGQGHRDVKLMRGIAEKASELCADGKDANEASARQVVESLVALEIEDVPEALLEVAGIESLDEMLSA